MSARDAQRWGRGFLYREAGPQQQLQAFLQGIVNSGGRIERECVFDRRNGVPWHERVFRRDETFGTRQITVWGM